MKNRFLGIICFIYSFLIIYVWLTDKLKNYLAPNMQIYLKLALILLIPMGIVLISKNKSGRLRFSDLFLLLPLVLIFVAGDGRLSLSLAANRTMNYTNKSQDKKSQPVTKEEVVTPIEVDEVPAGDIEIYFDVVDANYSDLASYISFDPKAIKYEGKGIRLKGFTLKDSEFLSKEYSIIGKYDISCCAADATMNGFIFKYDKTKIKDNAWYEIKGILKHGIDLYGYDMMYIDVLEINEIDGKNEEQYIYPCYSYDDGKCSEVLKYNLE